MNRSLGMSAVAVFAAGWAMFAASGAIAKLAPAGPPWLHQLVLKSVLAVLSLAAIRISGFRFERTGAVPWMRAIGVGLAMGAAASFVILLAGGKGMRGVMQGYSFPAIVLVIWIGSSVSEEIFTRGWVQTALDRFRDRTIAGLPAPVFVSALLFGSLHMSLYRTGADTVTAIAIPVFTFALGIWAGLLRHRTGSLAPAIAAHVAFNVGGAFGGIGWMLFRLALDGKLPVMKS